MVSQIISLLRLMSDGEFHSGAVLGGALGVSRAAVWKCIKKIESFEIEVHSVRGKGYRLGRPLELLNSDQIMLELSSDQRASIAKIDTLLSVDSTNSYALRQIQSGELALSPGQLYVCLAEQQTLGKGRRGREWASPFGNNMYLSVARSFESGAAGLEGLSLVIGLVLVSVLVSYGVEDLSVKWPNDVLWNKKKLAGILLEVTGDMTGACQLVVGIGLNVNVESDQMKSVDQPWVDLSSILPVPPGRNELIGKVVSKLAESMVRFEEEGFGGFHKQWQRYDALNGVVVELNKSILTETKRLISGIACGVNDQGALMIEIEGVVQTYHGGEVSVREAGGK